MNRLLRQEEIDALLNDSKTEPEKPDIIDLSTEEKDALGEVGNICMGSAATSLSLLINRKVVISSPELTICSPEDIFKEFPYPFISIGVDFNEGLHGNNLLLMKTSDAAVVADLMMGGTGMPEAGSLSEIQISATSEAMNQMISSAATAMASMLEQKIGISPPQTKVVEENMERSELLSDELKVVISFRLAIEDILDSQILQIMGLDVARAQAALFLSLFSGDYLLPPEEDRGAGDKFPQGATGSSYSTETTVEREEKPGLDGYGREAIKAGPLLPAEPELEGQATGLSMSIPEHKKLNLVMDIPLNVTVVLGRTRRPIKEVLKLAPGAVVELAEMVDEPVEVLVNGTLVAKGEVVVVNENFGVRITSIISPVERVQYLAGKTIM